MCETLQLQKTNRFLSHGTDLVLNLFQKTFILTHKNLNCYIFLSKSHMHYESERCVSGLWLVAGCLTIILRNRVEYHLILILGRRPSGLNQGIFRKVEQDNCFIIQQILINYHVQNEKNYGSMMKMLKASNT